MKAGHDKLREQLDTTSRKLRQVSLEKEEQERATAEKLGHWQRQVEEKTKVFLL